MRFALALRRRRDLREAARPQPVEHRRPARDRAATSAAGQHHPAAARPSRDRRAARAGRWPRPAERKHEVDLTYITSRGRWYLHSRGRATRRNRAGSRPISASISSTCSTSCSASCRQQRVHLVRCRCAAGGYLEYERRAGALVPVGRRCRPARAPQRRAASGPSARSRSTARRSSSPAASPISTPRATSGSSTGKGFGLEDEPLRDRDRRRRSGPRAPTGPSGDYHPLARRAGRG